MKVLDVCVGSEKIYFGMNKKLGDNFISIDKRKGDFTVQTKKNVVPVSIIIKPKVLADMRYLPFKDGSIDVIVMDPPHLNLGNNGKSFMAKAYGSWTKIEVISTVYKANIEFSRVLRKNGSLIIKVMPEDSDRYIKLLDRFTFFLPIHTIRQQGCFTNKEARAAAFWCVGIKND